MLCAHPQTQRIQIKLLFANLNPSSASSRGLSPRFVLSLSVFVRRYSSALLSILGYPSSSVLSSCLENEEFTLIGPSSAFLCVNIKNCIGLHGR
jgi:hypothetical protein